MRSGQTHIVHQRLYLLSNIVLVGNTVIEQRLSQSFKNRHTRVKRSVRVLKNHLHTTTPGHHLLRVKAGQIRAVKGYRALLSRHQLQ